MASLCLLHLSVLVIVIPVHLYSHYISFWKLQEEYVETLRPTMWLTSECCTLASAELVALILMFQSYDTWGAAVLSSNFACLCGMMEELPSLTGFLNEQMCFSHKLNNLIPCFSEWGKKKIYFSRARTTSREDWLLYPLKFWIWSIELRNNNYIIKYFTFNNLMFADIWSQGSLCLLSKQNELTLFSKKV